MLLTIHRYVFFEWLKVFLLSLVVTIGLLMIHDIYDNLPDFLAIGASISQIFFYYTALIPSFLPILIPLGLMISLLFSLGNLHRNQEIIALKAAGLGLWRIAASLLGAAGVLSLLLLYLNAVWVPWSVENTRDFLHRLELSHDISKQGELHAGLIIPFTYMSPKKGQYWVMQSFSEVTYQGHGVNVYVYNQDKIIQSELIAQDAYFDEVQNCWVFLRCRFTQFNGQGEPIFSQYQDSLMRNDYQESPVQMLLLHQDPEDLSLFEIKKILNTASDIHESMIKPYQMRYHNMLASPIWVLLVTLFAIPLAVSGVRVNPMISASKCVGLFFIYFFIHKLALILGDQGHLPVIVAVWLPVCLMLGAAFWIQWRNESVL